MTNGEKIRAMNDEELAMFIAGFNVCKVCKVYDDKSKSCNEFSKFICTKGYRELVVYEWLKQPVED